MDSKKATMDNKRYNSAATVQLCAHVLTMPALKDCIGRILQSHPAYGKSISPILRISDLGSAGGVNAIRLLQYIEKLFLDHNETRPVEYFFEDLPTSDFNELVGTIHKSNLSDQFHPMCVGKSFYEKLFPSNSIHLSLSYITLHWLRQCPDLKSYGIAKMISQNDVKFVQPNEANVNHLIFEEFRKASIADLTLFLKLRAEELCDNGEGLYLMLGGGSNDQDDPSYALSRSFIKGRNGSVYKEAFENAANDPQFTSIASKIKEAQLASFIPYFLRSESDVKESFDQVKDILELKEIKWEYCKVDNGTPEKLAELIWSIHGNALAGSIKEMLIKNHESHDENISSIENLHQQILNALQLHIKLISQRDFPDGVSTTSYMYLVVRRIPRK